MQNKPLHVPHADRGSQVCIMPGVESPDCEGKFLWPFGIQRNHGSSHNRLVRPTTRKTGRHPNRLIRIPPASVPNAGPMAMPATMLALAKPRLCSGKYRDKMVEHAG